MPVVIDGTAGLTTPNVTNSGTDSAAIQTYGGVAMPRMVLSTAQATTSGTNIDFTGIPSWVKRITVMFAGVSTNGASNYLIQLGTGSTTYTTSGYLGTSTLSSGGGNTSTNMSTGFLMNQASLGAAAVFHGLITIALIGSNGWVASGYIGESDSARGWTTGGYVPLGATLTAVRLTTVTGTDAFDAGSVNILYEG
jgi:hypothetical protein